MYIFTIPREKFDERAPDKRIIRQLISKHISLVGDLKKNMAYYQGKHKILEDAKRENRLVCNHAKDISDTASSYFIGNPVTYKSDADIKDLTDSLETAGADETDGDNGLDLSIYGLAYEYVYVKENENNLLTKNLSPENTFMVKDDSIEENELFAVYYYVRKDDSGTGPEHYIATVLTPNYKYELDIQNNEVPQLTTELPVPHYLGEIPIIEYLNNKLAIGDFELQIPLIDAYNALMSDRITDKEQFIDAILAIYGTLLSDEDEPGTEEEDQNIKKAKERLKKYKVLEMPDTAKAEYLTRTFDESGVEILKKAIEQDIHKFSHIPCMSDESFGGNVSGVAMEFKLLGMENITKIKTRYYRTVTVQKTAETLVHEITHHKYDIGGNQWSECVCRAQETKHRNSSSELEVIIETAEGKYQKDYVYLNDYTMYVVEDISGSDVDKYHYEINFLPQWGLKVTHND